jgi:F0F1-type ATP synthase assembly protein I
MARDPKKTKSMFGNMKPADIKALGIGLELTMVIGGLAYGGHWLDQKWDTDPWMLLTGVILGTFGGGWHAMKMANGGKLPDLGLSPKNKRPVRKDDQDQATED